MKRLKKESNVKGKMYSKILSLRDKNKMIRILNSKVSKYNIDKKLLYCLYLYNYY